jgi:peptide/nickel transport system permease protein
MSDLAPTEQAAARPASSRGPAGYWARVAARLLRDRTSAVCLLVLGLILAAAIAAPLIAPADPYQTSMLKRLQPIGTAGHPLGTDELGRDMLSRLIYGARLTLFMGAFPVLVAFVIGTFLGVTAGYFGRRTNMLIMRTADVFYAFPSILLAVAVSGALGGGTANALLCLILVWIPLITRVAESATAQVRNLAFVDAARASGAGDWTIILRHVLNNVLGPVFVYATSLIGVSIIVASGLSFLGLGAQPPEAEWGLMLNTLRTAIYINPWLAILPGVAMFVTSTCFNLLSDGLRYAMDMRAS